MDEFNSEDRWTYYCGQKSLRRNWVAPIVNKRVWNAVLGYSFKNDRKISLQFQGKPFNITVIQVYAPTNDSEEAEVDQFYENLEDIQNCTKKDRNEPDNYNGGVSHPVPDILQYEDKGQKKDVPFIRGDWNAKVGSQEIPKVTHTFGLGEKMKPGKG